MSNNRDFSLVTIAICGILNSLGNESYIHRGSHDVNIASIVAFIVATGLCFWFKEFVSSVLSIRILLMEVVDCGNHDRSLNLVRVLSESYSIVEVSVDTSTHGHIFSESILTCSAIA